MIALDALVNEMRLTYAERRDRLEAQKAALARGDKRTTFTVEEIAKRRGRLPQLEAVGRGLAALAARRDDVPEWILQAFEGGGDGV
ncbi:hypothetical protein CCR94_16415 [Rhodoblastus sphagnicola]|uniref:Uncharacterized protein n=1 Tax=Rhodoblastus sphagnicola TaxID=333368 RepID=A0A2S6N2X0_9HYPH|nr:hypothetical protein [Rhodoblastus sphagnicola]MBB4199081.1 hypothetical protein [Rhodoblastus sphagnicola]PPQ28974.1 hypothetical protein CCR94_16415 [Rhodoblastus sphagnicola]